MAGEERRFLNSFVFDGGGSLTGSLPIFRNSHVVLEALEVQGFRASYLEFGLGVVQSNTHMVVYLGLVDDLS